MPSKVMVTGAGGFVGACMVYYLSGRGFDVLPCARDAKSAWRLSESKAAIVQMDVTNPDSVMEAIWGAMPDIVINYATYGAYPTQSNPALIYDTNIKGVENLIAACRKFNVKRLIHTGSSSEYGFKTHPMSESDSLEPVTDYGKAKIIAHGKIMDAAREGLNCSVIRPFSVYGPWEDKNRLFPSVITSALENVPAKLTSRAPKRDFIYVDDLLDAYFLLMQRNDLAGETFNVGSGVQSSVGDVADAVCRLFPHAPKPVWGTDNPRKEPAMWQADIRKAVSVLGWKPKTDLNQGISQTADWFRSHLDYYRKFEGAKERQ